MIDPVVALFVVVAVAIVGAVAVLVSRDRPLIEPDPVGGRSLDWSDQDGVSGTSLSEVRFAVALRGYRMEQVDRVLDDTRAALAGRDARITDLQRVIAELRADAVGGARLTGAADTPADVAADHVVGRAAEPATGAADTSAALGITDTQSAT